MIPRHIIWHFLDKKHVFTWYIDTIKHMYNGVLTSVRTITGKTGRFPITIDIHQESFLGPYLFSLVIDDINRHIQNEVP